MRGIMQKSMADTEYFLLIIFGEFSKLRNNNVCNT
jgi:hypothetical protein